VLGCSSYSCSLAIIYLNRNRDRKLQISTASTKAKWREPAYSQSLYQNNIDRQGREKMPTYYYDITHLSFNFNVISVVLFKF